MWPERYADWEMDELTRYIIEASKSAAVTTAFQNSRKPE